MANKLLSIFLFGFVFFFNGTSEQSVLQVNSMSEQSCSFQSHKELAKLLHNSMTKYEIIQLLGESNFEGKSMLTNEEMWRYDLCPNEQYMSHLNEDAVDLEALDREQLKYIVFFTFSQDEKQLSSISMYYKDEQGNLHEYIQFDDGYIKDIMIEM